MAKYRGPVLYVDMEMIWPTAEMTHAVTMWKQCSPERPECHEFRIENRNARKYGGAVSRSVSTRGKPRVLTIDGKK